MKQDHLLTHVRSCTLYCLRLARPTHNFLFFFLTPCTKVMESSTFTDFHPHFYYLHFLQISLFCKIIFHNYLKVLERKWDYQCDVYFYYHNHGAPICSRYVSAIFGHNFVLRIYFGTSFKPRFLAGLKCYWCIGELDATMENWSSINRLNKIHQRFGEQIIPKCDTVKNDDTDFSWDCGNERE